MKTMQDDTIQDQLTFVNSSISHLALDIGGINNLNSFPFTDFFVSNSIQQNLLIYLFILLNYRLLKQLLLLS